MRDLINRILTWLFPRPDVEGEWRTVRLKRLIKGDDNGAV